MHRARFAAAAIAASVLVGAGAAEAQGFDSSAWYLKGFGGWAWPSDDNTDVKLDGVTIGSGEINYGTGYTLGAAIGYDVTPNVGIEFEYAYRNADVDEGNSTSNAIMLNALYKFNGMGANGAWQPYLGGGIGAANLDIDVNNFGTFSQSNGWAYQLIAGVGYDITPNWTLLSELRWFQIQNETLDGPGDLEVDSGYDGWDLLFGAAYQF